MADIIHNVLHTTAKQKNTKLDEGKKITSNNNRHSPIP